MTVYISTNQPGLRAQLKLLLRKAGVQKIANLPITKCPAVESNDVVIIDFAYFARVPLSTIFHFIESLRSRDIRIVFLTTARDTKILKSATLSLRYRYLTTITFPLSLKKVKAIFPPRE